jgi:hypothetical protein
MNVYNSENYTGKYNYIIDELTKIHGGTKIGMMLIVHPTTRHSNELIDPDGINFKEKFIANTPHPQPSSPIPFDQFGPTIHTDAVDGFFIQNEGSTLWKIYRNTGIEEHILNTGDMMYIPKNIIHSVDSLTPRNSTSIAFKDPQLDACPRCGYQNN